MFRRNRRKKAGERGNQDGETALRPMKKMQMESSTSRHLLMNNKSLLNLIISKMRLLKVSNLSTFLLRHQENWTVKTMKFPMILVAVTTWRWRTSTLDMKRL